MSLTAQVSSQWVMDFHKQICFKLLHVHELVLVVKRNILILYSYFHRMSMFLLFMSVAVSQQSKVLLVGEVGIP